MSKDGNKVELTKKRSGEIDSSLSIASATKYFTKSIIEAFRGEKRSKVQHIVLKTDSKKFILIIREHFTRLFSYEILFHSFVEAL